MATSKTGMILGLLALSVPLWVDSKFLLFLGTQAGVFMIVAIGLNLLMGYCGQISAGHGALAAIGAYTAAILMVDVHASFWVAALAAIVTASVAGAVMALPALRLSTWYFSLITLTFAQVTNDLIIEWRGLTRGFSGIVGIPAPSILGTSLGEKGLYTLVALSVVLAFILVRNLVHSRVGRAMVAARDNPLAAVASGVSLLRVKMLAFTISAALAGLGGALFAVQKGVITPDDFTADFSIFFLLVIVVGGLGRLWGPIVGTAIFFLVPEMLGSLQSWRMLVYGIALLLLMLFAPHGVVGVIEKIWRRQKKELDPNVGIAAFDEVCGASLKIESLSKKFGGITALDRASLELPPGQCHALVGSNGSGKTTLFNLVSGFYRPDSGSISLDNANVVRLKPFQVSRIGVGRTFQTPRLLGDLSVIENVMLGAFTTERCSALEISLGLPRARREAAKIQSGAITALQFVGLSHRAFDPAGEVPHGQQRLIEIARALVGRPRLLLLDEPAAGLSLTELDKLGELIRAIMKKGATIIIVEHHLDFVLKLASQVTALDQGKIIAAGSPSAVFSDLRVVKAFTGSLEEAAI